MALKRRVASVAEDVKKKIEQKPRTVAEARGKVLISSGSTMLNLALSGFSPDGGFALGTVVHIIGDTHAGKSLLALTMMAEAARDPRLKNYRLVYEEPESAMFFPIEEMFGEETKKRIEFIPKKEDRVRPRTVQDWHDDLVHNYEPPYVWVTDSFDALTSADDLKQESPTKGGWHTEKASTASQLFPKIVGKIESTDSLFVWISQTRDNIGVTFGPSKTFSGGNAIKFYRSYEVWLAVESKLKKQVHGKAREIGANVVAKIKKNKFTGRVREVSFPVYYDYGVDDIGSMVDFMVSEGYWGKSKQKIETEDPFIDATRDKLISHIEENNLEGKLKEVVTECWLDLESKIKSQRKPRY